jgi:hypothetical protein
MNPLCEAKGSDFRGFSEGRTCLWLVTNNPDHYIAFGQTLTFDDVGLMFYVAPKADIGRHFMSTRPSVMGPMRSSPLVIVTSPSSRFCPWSTLRPPHYV